jgi:tRNA-Thr(GGU) m(6)t(6)A37 methyltransferase TsaA
MRLKPIGIIHSPFQQATGTPIQPRFSDGAEGSVEIFSEFIPGLKDLAGFDRIWLLYWFHWARFEKCGLVVTPYLDDTPRGVFAARAPTRPNPVRLSPVRLLDVRGHTLRVRDLGVPSDLIVNSSICTCRQATSMFYYLQPSSRGGGQNPSRSFGVWF